ncbi:hypothetical protein [Pediococcus claussenii]|uniref:Uncharacterized protein n=1 Tax=Pediococcus claussenii (strain ATCC BAA-344 / DSM 14800 / JCM 18046 / KCTC 3811 / LMG 21948 / P06) TaxID=701521 RepID=G8PC33_PEDCP|nr:hypothetical protein [Pediococcus claussenii]AEV94852.1 hypothetical protein PECL_553 [Pediococcus claussenii ATCC BAA-344]ANZ70048.1 hypothetical protein AYR57_06840 [Pediococcus claussenii]ANZ71863.1 hypothetical protein AYR58_06840 [Pediococcus claussenii]KRN21030.1 hypothetical protein IV79_GL000256 [Pediococcus claussenii]
MHDVDTGIFNTQNPVIFSITKVNYQRYMTRAQIKVNDMSFPENDVRPKLLIEGAIKLGRMVQRGGMNNGQVNFNADNFTLADDAGEGLAEYKYTDVDWIQVGAVISEELSGYPFGYLWMLITVKAGDGEFHILNSDFKVLDQLLPLWKDKQIVVEDPLSVVQEWQNYNENVDTFKKYFTNKYENLRKNTNYPVVIKGENPVWGED